MTILTDAVHCAIDRLVFLRVRDPVVLCWRVRQINHSDFMRSDNMLIAMRRGDHRMDSLIAINRLLPLFDSTGDEPPLAVSES